LRIERRGLCFPALHCLEYRRTAYSIPCTSPLHIYRGADKSLARPTSLSIVFSVQGTSGSPTGPDPENRVGDQDVGSPGRPVASGLQVPGEPFPSWSGKGLISTPVPVHTGYRLLEEMSKIMNIIL
jgi:hypothetical protein